MNALSLSWTLVTLLLVLIGSRQALAWDEPGHLVQTRTIFSRLPKDIRVKFSPEILKEAIEEDSSYPDSQDPFDIKQIGADALAKLHEHGIAKREGLHSDTGRALIFVLLVDAFRAHRYERAALWIAALGHSTGDMAACNHDPLVHTLRYAYGADYNLKLPNGTPAAKAGPIDLGGLDNPLGAKILAQRINAMTLSDDAPSAERCLMTIMMYGYTGMSYLGPRGASIAHDAGALAASGNPAIRQKLLTTIADLGAWGVGRTVRDTEAAYRLAQSRVPADVTPTLVAKYRLERDTLIKTKPLVDEAVFRPILRPLPSAGAPRPGIVLEPCWEQNEGMLGYRDKLLAAGICRWLKETKHPYTTLDLRSVLMRGFPAPQRMPIVVISASELQDYAWMKKEDLNRQLSRYIGAGGRVLWIGATPLPPALGPLAKQIYAAEPGSWPLPIAEFVRAKLRVADTAWSFVRSPQTAAGWQQPYDPYRFHLTAEVRPLVELVGTGPAPVAVGAVWQPTGQAPRAAFLPVYVVSPFLLTKDEVLDDPAEPQLDVANKQVLRHTLAVLREREKPNQAASSQAASPRRRRE